MAAAAETFVDGTEQFEAAAWEGCRVRALQSSDGPQQQRVANGTRRVANGTRPVASGTRQVAVGRNAAFAAAQVAF